MLMGSCTLMIWPQEPTRPLSLQVKITVGVFAIKRKLTSGLLKRKLSTMCWCWLRRRARKCWAKMSLTALCVSIPCFADRWLMGIGAFSVNKIRLRV